MHAAAAAIFLVSTMIAAAPEKPAPAQDSSEVVNARQRAVAFLTKKQGRNKLTEYGGQEGGVPALVTLALLQSGVRPDDPRLGNLLANARGMKSGLTYVTSLQTLVLCAAEPKKDIDSIRRNVKWLEETQLRTKPRPGAWGYGSSGNEANTTGDNSNTQFAMLALHEADLVDASASEKTWSLALNHWLAEQREDGSWGYYVPMVGTGSMTCAGAACVSAASRRVKDKTKIEAAQVAVKRAEEWLKRNFTVRANPTSRESTGLWHFCYLCDLERAARLAGWSKLGDHNWRGEGVHLLLRSQDEDGAWTGFGHAEQDPVIATSLALLFLRPEPAEKSRPADKK